MRIMIILLLTMLMTSGTVNAEHVNYSCDKVKPFNDIPGIRRVWKESDHGGLVVLLPGKKKAKAVFIGKKRKGIRVGDEITALHHKWAKITDELYYTGIANGGRHHWRLTKSISDLQKKPLYLVVQKKNRTICYNVKKPRERND